MAKKQLAYADIPVAQLGRGALISINCERLAQQTPVIHRYFPSTSKHPIEAQPA